MNGEVLYYAATRSFWLVGYLVAFYLRWRLGIAFSREEKERSSQQFVFYGGLVVGWVPFLGEVIAFFFLMLGIASATAHYERAVDERVGAIEEERRRDKLLAENPDKAGNLSLTDQE